MISKDAMCNEMVRRKIQFHPDKKWNEIVLWGLFRKSYIKKWLDTGLLIAHPYSNRGTIWVRPSKELWESEILPRMVLMRFKNKCKLYAVDLQ